MQFWPTVCLDEKVTELKTGEGDYLELETETGNVHLSCAVIIAAGVGAFVPRTLDIPDVKRMEGKGLYYHVKDLERLRGQRVLVVGGGDTALDWAKSLLGVASEVTLIHRRGTFRAHEQTLKEVLMSEANVMPFYELKALYSNERVRAATVIDNRTGEEQTLDVEAVVLGLGFLANLGPIRDWGLEIVGNSIQVDPMMQTNLPGVFAVGDITTYEGKLKLIATATGEAATAANYAKRYVDPATRVFPGHSSHREQG
jgi:thioredoxin reductase (NADPH)